MSVLRVLYAKKYMDNCTIRHLLRYGGLHLIVNLHGIEADKNVVD